MFCYSKLKLENCEIKPIALPGIHRKFFAFFKRMTGEKKGLTVLDVGAGHGAFSKCLFEEGHKVEACDLHPEFFRFKNIQCKKADILDKLPYDKESYDVVVAVEVMEHVFDHEVFFSECFRILKKNGLLLISTPNILSLKSRTRLLFTGFFYSVEPLDPYKTGGLQHVSALTLDQYRYLGHKSGFTLNEVSYDKVQRISIFLLFLWPFLWIGSKIKKIDFSVHNRISLLIGRILFLKFNKTS
jgi:SAM-dependent methyltransferase